MAWSEAARQAAAAARKARAKGGSFDNKLNAWKRVSSTQSRSGKAEWVRDRGSDAVSPRDARVLDLLTGRAPGGVRAARQLLKKRGR